MTTPRLKSAANLPGTTGTSLPGRLRGPVVRESRSGDGPIATAMKEYGLELDNSGHVDADALRFMRWTADGWYVYEMGDHKEVEVYQGGDLGKALAALVGEQPQ